VLYSALNEPGPISVICGNAFCSKPFVGPALLLSDISLLVKLANMDHLPMRSEPDINVVEVVKTGSDDSGIDVFLPSPSRTNDTIFGAAIIIRFQKQYYLI